MMRRSGLEIPPTGRRVEYRGVDVIPLRDGLVARKDVYSDRRHAPPPARVDGDWLDGG